MDNKDFYTPKKQIQIRKKSDMYLIAAWMCFGAELDPQGVDRSDPRHVFFTVRGYDLDRIEELWVNGNLEGNLVKFTEKMRNLKSLIHMR